MTKEKQLFADSQMRKRKTPAQEDFERENYEVLSCAVDVINQALELMHNERGIHPKRYRGKNWAATTMNGFVQGLMLDKFPDKMKSVFGSYSYYSSTSILKFKKLTEKLIPENIKTEKVDRERHQSALPFETNIPIIYVGYTVDSTMDQITGCYAVCLDDWDKIIWVSDLNDLADSSNNRQEIEINPIDTTETKLVKLKAPAIKKVE